MKFFLSKNFEGKKKKENQSAQLCELRFLLGWWWLAFIVWTFFLCYFILLTILDLWLNLWLIQWFQTVLLLLCLIFWAPFFFRWEFSVVPSLCLYLDIVFLKTLNYWVVWLLVLSMALHYVISNICIVFFYLGYGSIA